jgi:hypothetical protein
MTTITKRTTASATYYRDTTGIPFLVGSVHYNRHRNHGRYVWLVSAHGYDGQKRFDDRASAESAVEQAVGYSDPEQPPTIKDALAPLLEATDPKQRYVVVDGLTVTVFPSGVLHIDRREGDLERADVDATRAAFTELGYDELESWVATQGASWLSDGVATGVSFRIAKAAS